MTRIRRICAGVAIVGAVAVLATACGVAERGSSGSSADTASGPDDTSDLWTALRWGIEVDYPQQATVQAMVDEADLVVRGRVVGVGRPASGQDDEHAEVLVDVVRVLSDPDGVAPDRLILAVPVNWQTDLDRVAAEAPRPPDVVLSLGTMGDPVNGVPRYGMITGDSVIDVRDGLSYTPFNDVEATPGDPFRGHTLDELEAAFLTAASS